MLLERFIYQVHFSNKSHGIFSLLVIFVSLFLMPLLIIYIALPQGRIQASLVPRHVVKLTPPVLNPIIDNVIHAGNALWCLHAPLLSYFLWTSGIHRIPHIFHKSERSPHSKFGNFFYIFKLAREQCISFCKILVFESWRLPAKGHLIQPWQYQGGDLRTWITGQCVFEDYEEALDLFF